MGHRLTSPLCHGAAGGSGRAVAVAVALALVSAVAVAVALTRIKRHPLPSPWRWRHPFRPKTPPACVLSGADTSASSASQQ